MVLGASTRSLDNQWTWYRPNMHLQNNGHNTDVRERMFSAVFLNLGNANNKTKLRGFGPRANYADRATSACWRGSANFCG
jgi:hypothetical protein